MRNISFHVQGNAGSDLLRCSMLLSYESMVQASGFIPACTSHEPTILTRFMMSRSDNLTYNLALVSVYLMGWAILANLPSLASLLNMMYSANYLPRVLHMATTVEKLTLPNTV